MLSRLRFPDASMTRKTGRGAHLIRMKAGALLFFLLLSPCRAALVAWWVFNYVVNYVVLSRGRPAEELL